MTHADTRDGRPGLPEQALPEITGYRVLRALGVGGMSTIYLGEQRSLRRQVAIKVMLPEALTDETSRKRFENEARTIARLEHPHIVGIHEVGRTRDDLPFYVMPYLPRGHLGQRDVTGDHARIRAILRALLSALAYAHARGVIHRDVKAENVLFDEAERPLLADFGIALRRGFGSRVTSAGIAVGSTAYMAPEQARGEEVDFRTDLYSVGVLTWEMLTGELPFKTGDALSMVVMHAQDPVPRLPPELRHWQGFIDKAMAKAPGKRYRDAQEMLAALDHVPQKGVRTLPPVATRARAVWARLRRLPPAAWIGAVLVLAAGIGLATRDGEGPGFFRPQAEGIAAVGAGDPTTRARALPVPGASADQPVIANPEDALLRAAPKSTAELLVMQAEQQIRAGKLTAPRGDNAQDSLLAAWQGDRSHLRVSPTIDHLLAALGHQAAKRLADGQDARARELVAQATRLAERTERASGKAMQALGKATLQVLEQRVDRAAADYDRPAALRGIAEARQLGVGTADARALAARAQRIPQAGDRVADPSGEMQLVRVDDGLVAGARHPVSRGAYTAFASATGREESLCRERTSLLRIVARRSWRTPGFEQGPGDPVVCVSWQDAQAYADWLSQRHGHRYRLPSAGESRLLPDSSGAKPVAEWARDCSGGCDKRVITGRSWRGGDGARAQEATRGFDDVGFRVVREP
ncbi:MAG: bifunctional serine/threonine-protein kinase/formylglycine-generating enzyme family protein [Luteimonas sp.]